MGVAIPVSEILLLSKMVKFPFPTMDSVVVNYVRCQYPFSILKSALRCLRGSRSNHITLILLIFAVSSQMHGWDHSDNCYS